MLKYETDQIQQNQQPLLQIQPMQNNRSPMQNQSHALNKR